MMPTVLIIDDAIDICFLLSHMLKQQEIIADSVHTISDASAAINNKFYPIIILDNHLPDGLGLDFIECIKKDSPESKIIMITAYANEGVEITATNKGADLFISKPFTRDKIFESISKFRINSN